jgi:hypothetical protein
MKEKKINELNDIWNLNKEKELVKICFYSMNEQILYESEYPINLCIGNAINDFISKNNNKENYSFYIKNNDSLDNLINEQNLISFYVVNVQDTFALMEANISSSITTSSSKCLKIYVKKENIPENIEEYIIKNTQYIGRPALNQMKYYVYNKKTAELKLKKLSKETIDKIKIKYFSRNSVYCNVCNNLYLYEGVGEYIDNNYTFSKFICINLKDDSINLISSKFPPRLLHSMIFIPENYIFIVGGKDTKEVIMYIIKDKNKKYEIYPHSLPYELYEPSLIVIDNKYLYAFENSSNFLHITRTDFIYKTEFEDIQLKNDNFITINQKFFGVVKHKNSILFLGGQMINPNHLLSKNSFEFNYITNKLKQSQRKYKYYDFFEKTLIPLGDEEYIQLVEYSNGYCYKPLLIKFDGETNKNNKNIRINNSKNSIKNGFISNHITNINIHLPDNISSLIGTSSFGDIAVPLYNNIANNKNK